MVATVTTLPTSDRERLRAAENALAVERERFRRVRLDLLTEQQAHRATQKRLRKVELELAQTKLLIRSTLETLEGAAAGTFGTPDAPDVPDARKDNA